MPISARTSRISCSRASAAVTKFLVVALLYGAAVACAEPVLSPVKTPVEAGLVDVAKLAPDIAVDLRYAGSDNFVGQRIDGYYTPRCLLLASAAQALARVERTLRKDKLRLKMFDCYRPARAGRHFVEWAGDITDQRTKAQYYPRLDKSALLGDYIAPISSHSRGATIDLTLERCERARCTPLDMGTDFDFFDVRAHTDAPEVTAEQRANRHRLRAAMHAGGFSNYAMEWWHYTLNPEPARDTIFDVPVR